MNLKERAGKLKADIPAVFIALGGSRTPLAAKIPAALTIIYALSPIDFIPDFIPVLGYLDDIIILPVLVALTLKFIPSDVWEQSRKNAESLWADGKPKKWYYALPIVLFWAVILLLVAKAIFNK